MPIRLVQVVIVAVAVGTLACGGAAAPTATRLPATATTAPTTATVAPTRAGAPSPTPVPVVISATPALTPTQQPRVSLGKIVYANIVDIGTTQPLTGTLTDRWPYSSSVNVGLTATDMQNRVTPWGAKKWEFSEGGRVITFTVRDDIYFHDGTKATVDDWVYRINDTWLRPKQPGAVAYSRPPIPEKAEKVDESRFRLLFPSPDPLFIEVNTRTDAGGGLAVVPKAYIERVGFEEFAKKPVLAGPYRLMSWSILEKVVLEAHDKFFAGPPPVKTIEMRVVPEDSTRLAMLLAGEADVAVAMPPQFLPRLEREPGVKDFSTPINQEAVFHFQTNLKTVPGTDIPNPFRDVRVRRAVAYSIDKKGILEHVVGRAGGPAIGPWSAAHLGWDGNNIVDYEYNPQKAKQLLEEAKYPFNITFKLYVYKLSAPMPEAFQAAANYMNEIGMKVQYTLLETGTFFAQWPAMGKDPTVSTLYPMGLVRHYTSSNPLSTLYSFMGPKVGFYRYEDPTLDSLFGEALRTAEPKAHEEVVKKLYHYLHEQVYIIDLYAQVDHNGLGRRVDWSYPTGSPSHLENISWRPGYP